MDSNPGVAKTRFRAAIFFYVSGLPPIVFSDQHLKVNTGEIIRYILPVYRFIVY